MSIHRFAARRDDNEPTIIARFATHGWHTEQLSGTGLPDLLCWRGPNTSGWRQAILVDVKMPKGALKPAQVKKWTALHAKGIPVYVVRTEEDVDALVAGTLEPWGPTPHGGYGTKQSKRGLSSRKGDAAKAREEGRKRLMDEQWDVPLPDGRRLRNKPRTGAKAGRADYVEAYTPPRSTPPDAAKPMGMGHAIRHQDPEWLKARVPGLAAALQRAEGTVGSGEAVLDMVHDVLGLPRRTP